MARGTGSEEEVEGLDEEFLYHLSRGSDLLTRGESAEARHSLQRAAQLRPKDGKVLGLLGQACYRMGRFDDAAEAYGRLVDDNPTEVAARVNLGLANLKARRFAGAVKQFSIALDLNPDHKKAMGYLGLAHFESGDPKSAREWFERAGSLMMVARCDEVLAADGAEVVARPSPTPAVEDVPVPDPEPIRDLPPSTEVAVAGLGAYAARRTVRISRESFAVEGRVLSVAVNGEMLARLDGLFAVRGNLSLKPEVKRFRGQPTDKPFGDGPERVHRAAGEGTLLYRAGGAVYTVVDLAGEAGYFREETVFALEEPVVFENGRVPSKHSRDLNLVHLRGRGRFLLRTTAEPVALEVGRSAPLRVPVEALVGWTGAITPRIVLLGGDSDGEESKATDGPAVVELTGEGRALVDPDAAPSGLGRAP